LKTIKKDSYHYLKKLIYYNLLFKIKADEAFIFLSLLG